MTYSPLPRNPAVAELPMPIARVDGRWHLAIGRGSVPIHDEALVRDLQTLSTLLAPAPARTDAGR
ncbi:hypothetical protein AB0D10_25180 [Kitasatospora sp. NPDC048545]|uniref:hypothetical protein n=1 Tax=Kitasatospora sp. NPDC048545 TaxID=3157208 RepID=UPI003403386F